MSKADSIKKKVQGSLKAVKENFPYETKRNEEGNLVIERDEGFNPTKEGERDKIFLIKVDGQDTTTKEVRKKGDDMVLEYEDKYCAITSKPLLIDGNQFYFTRDGFLGTMALNKDTLLNGDVFQASKEDYKRKISKDIDFTELAFDPEKLMVDETDDYYIVPNTEIGDVATLQGSKKTLKEVNKAKRLRKLLQPSSMDKKKLLMAVGSGVALGFYLYPYIQGQ